MALLVDAIRGGRFGEALPLLEEAAVRDFPAAATAMLAHAALLDEGRAGGRQAVRLGREAMTHLPPGEAAPINLLLRAPELRAQYGEASRRRVENELNWASTAQSFVRLYREALGRRKRNKGVVRERET